MKSKGRRKKKGKEGKTEERKETEIQVNEALQTLICCGWISCAGSCLACAVLRIHRALDVDSTLASPQ